ncbi:hypothetical protein D3C75_721960 [compost metagenome]
MVARQCQCTAPGIFEVHPGQHRETPGERFAVALDEAVQVFAVAAPVGVVAEAVADQQAVVDGAAHGGAERVGRDHAPVGFAAQARLLFLGQRAGDAAVGEHRQHAALEEAEAHAEGVGGEHQLVGGDRTVGMTQHYLVAVVDLGDGRAFIQRNVGRQAVGQAFDQRRRLQQGGAGGEQALAVEMRADVLGQVAAFDHFVGLAELVQAAAVGIQHGDAAVFDGRLVLAAVAELALDVVALDQLLEVGLATQVELEDGLGDVDVADVVLGADVVRQVDGKAGVAPGGAKADLLGLDQHDLVVREVRCQLPCGSQAGETGADHHPARLAVPTVGRPWRTRFAQVVPATGGIIGR